MYQSQLFHDFRLAKSELLFLFNHLSSELLHELFVELDDPSNPLGTRRQEGSSEVECVLLLTKSCTRDNTYSGCIEETECVKFVRGTFLFLCSLDGFFWEFDGREEIH